jgi:hypothetical protein
MRVFRGPLALLACLALLAAAGSAHAAGKGIPWQSNLKKAQAQAVKQKKLVMVDFSAPW